jgi:uncharacterized MAPEG superfamily protein
MTVELWMITAAAMLQFGLIATHGIYIFLHAGMAWGIGKRDTPMPTSDASRRIERSLLNNMESLAVFIPLLLTLHLANIASPLSQIVAASYLTARLAFALIYIANIPYIRTGVWLIGQFSLIALAVLILSPIS